MASERTNVGLIFGKETKGRCWVGPLARFRRYWNSPLPSANPREKGRTGREGKGKVSELAR